jgi:hypothetical protein
MIFTSDTTMDPTYHSSSDGESGNKKTSNSASYEMVPLADDFEPTSLDGTFSSAVEYHVRLARRCVLLLTNVLSLSLSFLQ